MDELVAWLRGVLDELERVAEAAPDGPWSAEYRAVRGPDAPPEQRGSTGRGSPVRYVTSADVGGLSEEAAEHVALHDPRSSLARVEAERGVLAYFTRTPRTLDHLGYIAYTPLMWIAYGHRFDAPGYDPTWAPADLRD